MKIIIDTETDNIPKIIAMLKRYIGDDSSERTSGPSVEIPSDGSMFDMFSESTKTSNDIDLDEDDDPLEKIDIIHY